MDSSPRISGKEELDDAVEDLDTTYETHVLFAGEGRISWDEARERIKVELEGTLSVKDEFTIHAEKDGEDVDGQLTVVCSGTLKVEGEESVRK